MERELQRCFAALSFSKPCWDKRRIRRHWRKLSIKHHPDNNGDAAMFQSVQRAYNTIRCHMQQQQRESKPMTAEQNWEAIKHHQQVTKEHDKILPPQTTGSLDDKIVDKLMTRQQYDRGIRGYHTRNLQIERMFDTNESFNPHRFHDHYQDLKKKKQHLQIIVIDPEPINKQCSYASFDPSDDKSNESAYDWTKHAVLNHMNEAEST